MDVATRERSPRPAWDAERRNISVLSPVGFGLDEKAVECVSEWRFKAGMKEGHPVNIRAQVQVNFRLIRVSFDQKPKSAEPGSTR